MSTDPSPASPEQNAPNPPESSETQPTVPPQGNATTGNASSGIKRGPIQVGNRRRGQGDGPGGGGPGGGGHASRPRRDGGQPGESGPSRRDKERSEDAEVDESLASDKKARAGQGPKPPVPVPSRRQMSEELEAEVAAALGGLSLDELTTGDAALSSERLPTESRHRAQVADISGDDVFFTLGGRNQGVASLRSFKEPPKVGDVIEVVVTGFNSADELYDVVIPGGTIVAGGDWSDISEGSVVEARITAANSGGLECMVNNIRGFIPAGQVALYRIENFAEFVGQKLVCVVTESNERRGNLVLSRRAILEREKEQARESLLAELQPGQMREGIVRKIQDFGAFVDLGGIDGLIHVSQLSWERVKHPSEVVTEGQKVRVRIEKIDTETGKIGLSLKNPEEHPWMDIEQKLPIGAMVRGPVTRIAQFGAFVRLLPGVEGLIHISELAHHRVYKVDNIVKEGQEVEVKVLPIDPEAQRIGLSLKATLAKPVKEVTSETQETEVEEPPRESVVPKRRGPLKGGIGKGSGGDQFGLKW